MENGTTFDVPLVSEDVATEFMIYDATKPETLENNDAILINVMNENSTPGVFGYYKLDFKYPDGLRKEDVSGVIAEIIGQTDDNLSNDPDKNIATRASKKKIGVWVDTDDNLEGPNFYPYIKRAYAESGDTYIIRATLIKSDGSTLITARAIRFVEPMKVGDILYNDLSYSSTLIDGKTPIGIIFSLDPDRIGEAEKEALAAKGVTKPTGLAMALSDASVPGNIVYHNKGANASGDEYIENDYKLLWCVGNDIKEDEGYTVNTDPDKSKPAMLNEEGLTDCLNDAHDFSLFYNDISGLKNSQFIWQGGAYQDVKKYPAFYAAQLYGNNHNSDLPEGTTGWFFPSMGQWIELFKNLGNVSFDNNFEWNNGKFFAMQEEPEEDIDEAINQYFGKISANAKLNVFNKSCYYQTSSEGENDYGSYIHISTSTNSLYLSFGDKDAYMSTGGGAYAYRVRCILAF